MPDTSPQGTSQEDPRITLSMQASNQPPGHTSTGPPGQKGWCLEGLSPGHHRVSRPSGSQGPKAQIQGFITRANAASSPPGSLGATT